MSSSQFLTVWNLISVGVSGQRDVEYWWKAHKILMCFFSAGLLDSRRVRSLISNWLRKKRRRILASVGFQTEQGPLNTTYCILGETQIILVCISASHSVYPSRSSPLDLTFLKLAFLWNWRCQPPNCWSASIISFFCMEEAISMKKKIIFFPKEIQYSNRNQVWFTAVVKLFQSPDPSHHLHAGVAKASAW